MSQPPTPDSASPFPLPSGATGRGGLDAWPADPPAPLWVRLLRALENPFSLLDAIAAGRGLGRALFRHLFIQGLLLLLPLLVMEGLLWQIGVVPVRQSVVLFSLVLIHGGSCALAGMGLGNRFLADEHLRGNLDALRLVSTSPWKWVPLKLVFPVAALVMVWATALPFYAMLAVRGISCRWRWYPGRW